MDNANVSREDKKALYAIKTVFLTLSTEINPMLPAALGVIDLTDKDCECVKALIGHLPRVIEILSRKSFTCPVERRATVSTVVELFEIQCKAYHILLVQSI